jgi:acyl-CoA hydrolase
MAVQVHDEMEIVDQVIDRIGKKIVLGTPLAAGKANHIINALYKRAKSDSSIDLSICTALTLEKPTGKSELEKRFLQPFVERVFGDYPDLLYEKDRLQGNLPKNIRVIEFYFPPGKYLGNKSAQQDYVSSNYTHVMRDMLDRGINVIAQIVSKREDENGCSYSLSCNPDVTLDLQKELRKRKAPLCCIGQVNQNLPYMLGDAEVDDTFFDFILDDPKKYFTVFGPPKTSISAADYMIGLYSSLLLRDDGEIQIGIGTLGDSTVYSLLLRHQDNATYKTLLKDFRIPEKFGKIIEEIGSTDPFEKGLFGASEMLVDGFQHLYEAGIVKKKAFDHIGLQRLINKGLIKEDFEDHILDVLVAARLISPQLRKKDFNFLQYWGIFKADLHFNEKAIYSKDGKYLGFDLSDAQDLARLKKNALGQRLLNGQIMQGGFFLGPQSFYQWLKNLPEAERKLINMKSVLKINQLYGHEALDRLHRKNARFINSCMMQTILGAAVSDGLENGQVVSGVGGQYNFVAMAQELPDGHSILNLRSTRQEKGKINSNIISTYGHTTIPRHLRDIVVTEYGIAYIRGCTDEEIIKRLLNISDSRFQAKLLLWAKEAGKIEASYQIPDLYKANFPSSYLSTFKKYKDLGYFPSFPFGTDLTEDEMLLGKALKSLKKDLSSFPKLLVLIVKGWTSKASKSEEKLLKRMQLEAPKNFKERVYRALLLAKLKA